MKNDKALPILMGRNNPDGWKLEDLLQKLFAEVHAKSAQIHNSAHKQRDMILNNNAEICKLLCKARKIQISTYRELDAMAPNLGPSNPRL